MLSQPKDFWSERLSRLGYRPGRSIFGYIDLQSNQSELAVRNFDDNEIARIRYGASTTISFQEKLLNLDNRLGKFDVEIDGKPIQWSYKCSAETSPSAPFEQGFYW